MSAASALLRFFSFPLLTKELTEAAARRRTYIIRVAYGVLLFALIALWMPDSLWPGNSFTRSGMGVPVGLSMAMGAGSEIFGKILLMEFVGLALFLPALMAGSITHEKERDSLVLLLLTELRPWSIILQKYFGNLVPVASFLLLALPLTAIAYAFGGVSEVDLLVGAAALTLTALQVGALSLMLSAWCRTTVGAFIGTYVWTAVLYLAPPFLVQALMGRSFRYILLQIATVLIPAELLQAPMMYSLRRGGRSGYPASVFASYTFYLVFKLIVIFLSIVIFLCLARFFLVRRAILPSSSLFLRLFRILDRLMQWANRFVGNIVLVRDSRSLPEDEPVAWREITRKALGKAHYLFRILVAVEIPVAFICATAALETNYYSRQCDTLSVVAGIVGALGVLALGAQAANAIVSERIQQTLDVLLTTPLGAAEIVRQKAQALRRLMWILAVPMLTIFATECWMEHDFAKEWRAGIWRTDNALMYAVCSALTLAIFVPLVSWLALWIGLKMRTRFKAIISALAIIMGWCALPLLTASLLHAHGSHRPAEDAWLKAVGLLSPVAIVGASENGQLRELELWASPYVERALPSAWRISRRRHLDRGFETDDWTVWSVIFATFSFYALVLFLIRRQALRHADFYLRR